MSFWDAVAWGVSMTLRLRGTLKLDFLWDGVGWAGIRWGDCKTVIGLAEATRTDSGLPFCSCTYKRVVYKVKV